MIDSGMLRLDGIMIRKEALQFVEGLERVYGPNFNFYEANI